MKKQGLMIFAFFFFLNIFVSGQESVVRIPGRLTHWPTPEEKLRWNEIGRGFVETPPPEGQIRNIAEYDRMQAALVAYVTDASGSYFGIPFTLIKEMAKNITVTTLVENSAKQQEVIQKYINNGIDTSHCNFLIASLNSYWTRDYGPWFVSYQTDSIAIVDFPYNRPRPKDDEVPKKVAAMLGIPWFGMDLSHTGGNYMTDGMGVASSTELVWEENPGLSAGQISQKVHDYLGIEAYQVRPDPNGTYIDHIDCWGKFLAQDKILIRKVPPTHSQYATIEAAAAFWTTQICPYGYPYKVYRVNTPNDQPYTNSIILNNKVLVPYKNSSWDDSAKAVYETALPGYEIIGFTGLSSAPWESTDALHCRVMGIADIGLLYIKHLPVWGNQPAEQDYIIQADIIRGSHQPIKTDSVLIWYKVNNGPYQVVPMINTTGDHFLGVIPKQPGGSTIRYYLFAADESGRRETCPLIGAGNPFQFNTVYTDITAIPDTVWFNTADEAINGKPLTIHNLTETQKTINDIDSSGEFWWVNPWPVVTLPHNMDPGDSVQLTLHAPVVVKNILTSYVTDTMNIVSAINTHQVIIMVNAELLNGTRDITGNSNSVTLSNYPNPFVSHTTLCYQTAHESAGKIELFDWSGRLIKSWPLYGNTTSVCFDWNGCDENGQWLPGGIYFLKLTTEEQTITRKLVLIR